MTAFEQLLTQIDAFIRKFYKNQMLKGALFVLLTFFVSWLIVGGLEYIGRFNSAVRLFLLIVFCLTNLFILTKFLIIPALRLVAIGKRINRFQAAEIIGRFFPSVSDRLLNTLQLNEAINENDRSFELLRASVVQRSSELSTIAFVEAIKYSESKRYLKVLVPLALFIGVILWVLPDLLLDATGRVVRFDKAQPAPFQFSLLKGNDLVDEGESVEVITELSGRYIPEDVYIISSRGKYRMKQVKRNAFAFTFDNIKQATDFEFSAEGINSDDYRINVVGKSAMGRLVAECKYPSYLGKKNEVFTNVADLDIPEGTEVNWIVEAKNVSNLGVLWNDELKSIDGDHVMFSKRYENSGRLSFVLTNGINGKKDTSSVYIKTIKDAYPSIEVVEQVDSLKQGIRAFSGAIGDDYGLTRLNFQYEIAKKNGKKIERTLSVQPVSGVADKFTFAVDFSREELDVNDVISYYFMVYDNDGVNGSKGMKSKTFVYELPDLAELNEKRDKIQDDAQKSIEQLLKKADKFQRDVDKLQKNVLNNKKADFQTMEQIQQLQQQQEQLKNQLEDVQEKLQQSNEEKSQLTEMNEELMKQQELIDELMKEVMDDDLKKLLDELEELMKNNQQNQLKEESQKLDQSTDEMKKQLDRTLEMLKRLQVNEKIDDLQKELKELAKEQEKLAEQVEKKELSKEDALKEQDELNKKFDELQKDMKELNELNESLKRPLEISDFKQEQEDIDKEQQEAGENIEEGKNNKASEKQKKAAADMKKMAENLEKQKQKSNQKQNQEDMGLLRLLLENLMSLSFSQESTMDGFMRVRDNDPNYKKLGRKQRAIIDDTKVVEDSLIALAKRQPKVSAFIDKELAEIKSDFKYIVDEIDEHKRRELLNHQQLVMTSYNNLALLLNESLQSMQQQQQGQGDKDGDGKSDNPGSGNNGKPKMGSGMSGDDMKEMLKKQLDQLKKGQQPGGKQPGDKPGMGQGKPGNSGLPGMGSKEIAKMAAQQSAIRQRLEQMRNELNKEGQGKGNGLNPLIKELEQQEKDLINKNFSPDMIRRQQDILTRLLESEKAMRERGFDEKRESKSGKDQNPGNLIRFDEYNKKKLSQIELLKVVDPKLSKYYKDKADQYFNRAQ